MRSGFPVLVAFVFSAAAGFAQDRDSLESGELIEMQSDTAVPGSLLESETVPSRWNQPPHHVTVTVSPIWAFLGAADVSVEYRSGPDWGFLLNAMAGEFRFDDPTGFFNNENDLLSVRGQVRRYLSGEGGHFAVEFSRWSITEPMLPGRHDRFVQWRVGGLVGHKVVLPVGLTFDIQMGGYFAVVEEDPYPDNGTNFNRASPVLRANVGWSF